jgi:hypothetical protein
VDLFGAIVWWQAARVMTGHRRAFSIVLMFVAAVAALFTKRIGLILVGVSVAVTAASLFMQRAPQRKPREALLVTVAVIIGLVMMVALGFLFRDQVLSLRAYWTDAFTPRTSLADTSASEAFRFARMTVDYFWLIAGWLRFQPPVSWLWVARALIVLGMIGAVVRLVTSPSERVPLSVAWLFVAAQLVAMLATVFWLAPSAPQARYLFPVFVPITVLLYVGLRHLVPDRYRAQWPVALVVVLMMMDVTGFTTVHLRSYLP